MRARSAFLSLLVVAGTMTGMVATSAPAAALPTCGGLSVYYHGGAPFLRPTTVSNSHDLQCVLGIGNTGWVVSHLQTTLRNCYGQAIAVDGIYGSQTAGAVRNAQRIHRVPVDGVLGTVTNYVMFWTDDGGDCVFR
jgi:hypothetical protein